MKIRVWLWGVIEDRTLLGDLSTFKKKTKNGRHPFLTTNVDTATNSVDFSPKNVMLSLILEVLFVFCTFSFVQFFSSPFSLSLCGACVRRDVSTPNKASLFVLVSIVDRSRAQKQQTKKKKRERREGNFIGHLCYTSGYVAPSLGRKKVSGAFICVPSLIVYFVDVLCCPPVSTQCFFDFFA